MIIENPLNAIGATRIIASDLLCKRDKRVQYRFPKSKKKRIRKKWSRRQENYKYVPDDIMLKVGGILYISRRINKALKAGFENSKHSHYEEPTIKLFAWMELGINLLIALSSLNDNCVDYAGLIAWHNLNAEL